MDFLKLGLAGLPEAEANLISTLFRLHRVEPSFIWTLESKPPFDAILVEAHLAVEAFQPLCSPRTSVMRLSSPGMTTEGEMPRPIRSDRLIAWLNAIEVGLLHGGQDGFSSTLSPSRPSHSHALVAAQPAKISAPTQPAAVASIDTSDAALLFKLKRWPPTAALGKDISRIRLSTVLSRKPISLEELTSISRISKHECETFLRSLSQLNLIAIERRSAAALNFELLADFSLKEEPPKTVLKGGLSLIRSIRRRFGLI